MKKNFFIITAVVCGMSCTTTAYAQFKIGGKKINVIILGHRSNVCEKRKIID